MMIHRPSRNAFTLMELLGVMGGLGIALMLGILFLGGVLSLQKVSSRHHANLSRHADLTERFRADVHAALECRHDYSTDGSSDVSLHLKLTDGRVVVYRFAEHALERIEGEHRQSFVLSSPAATVTFASTEGSAKLVTLTLTEPQKHRDAIPWEITARLGGTRR